MPRLFTALEIPRNVAMSLSLLRGGIPGARWIDVENYHITLRFIGDVDGRTADEIVDRLDRIDRPEFQTTLTGIGSFGSKKPHSVYASVAPAPEMYALQGEIERICQRIGLPPDPRKFTPHVTLGRLKTAVSMMSYTTCQGAVTSTLRPLPFRASCFFRRRNPSAAGLI